MPITWVDFDLEKPPLCELLIIKRGEKYRNHFLGRFRCPWVTEPEKYNSDYYEILETHTYDARYKPLEKNIKYYYSELD